MPSWLMYLALTLAAAVALVLLVARSRPDHFKVTRTRAIGAPPERVYPMIADLRAMNTWNPFVEPDPAIEITYAGPALGTGAIHTWNGNRQVGSGRLEILDDEADRRLVMRLQMFRPFKADNRVEFTLTPTASGTDVSWTMSGPQPLMAKVMAMMIDCDRMVGGQFDKGLAKLESLVER